jgi:GTP-binding protein HflX
MLTTAIENDAGNGKVLSCLAAHAEIYREEFHDNRVCIRFHLPRHLLHHNQGAELQVRFLSEDGKGANT